MNDDFTSRTRKVALITGASSGIGADLARVFARFGHDLALVARDRARLAALADEIAETGRPRPLVVALDLAGRSAPGELDAALASGGVTVEILVNNAGFGLVGRARELPVRDQIEMIDLNVRALTELTYHFLPDIIAAKGRIMNVASVAGFLPGPGMATYYASKAYVVSLSAALAQELADDGVVVSALCPGPTPTGFQQRAGTDRALSERAPSTTSMQVAEAGYRGLMAGKRRVTPGLLNRLLVAAFPFIPDRVLLPILGRMQLKRLAPK